jgi:DNA-directed RNA polymerase subunit RPC12/RpoP
MAELKCEECGAIRREVFSECPACGSHFELIQKSPWIEPRWYLIREEK